MNPDLDIKKDLNVICGETNTEYQSLIIFSYKQNEVKYVGKDYATEAQEEDTRNLSNLMR
jgi:hypothetical protein